MSADPYGVAKGAAWTWQLITALQLCYADKHTNNHINNYTHHHHDVGAVVTCRSVEGAGVSAATAWRGGVHDGGASLPGLQRHEQVREGMWGGGAAFATNPGSPTHGEVLWCDAFSWVAAA
jgi:hypothetical protein